MFCAVTFSVVAGHVTALTAVLSRPCDNYVGIVLICEQQLVVLWGHLVCDFVLWGQKIPSGWD